MTGASFNRKGSRQDYETPPDFIQAVERRFGIINCDFAASKLNSKGQVWIDEAMDSLSADCPWNKYKGICWLNPPFSNIAPWAEKCWQESEKGAKILFLVPASVGSNWFAKFVFGKANVLFLNGRLQFVGASDPYPKDCILACYGYGIESFEIWKWK